MNEREPILENPRLGPSINHITNFSLPSDLTPCHYFCSTMGHCFPLIFDPPLLQMMTSFMNGHKNPRLQELDHKLPTWLWPRISFGYAELFKNSKYLISANSFLQKYSRPRCLLRVKCLVIFFFFIWADLEYSSNHKTYNKGRFKVIATYLQQ